MASESFIMQKEQEIISTIQALRYEATVLEDNFKVSPEHYSVWFSLMENTELLLKDLKAYVLMEDKQHGISKRNYW